MALEIGYATGFLDFARNDKDFDSEYQALKVRFNLAVVDHVASN